MVHVNIGVINTDTEPTVHEKAAAILIYKTRTTSTAPSGPVTSFCVIFFERCRDTNIKTLVWQSLEVPERHSFTWMSVRSATRLDFGGGRDAKDSKRSKEETLQMLRTSPAVLKAMNSSTPPRANAVRNTQRGPSSLTETTGVGSIFPDTVFLLFSLWNGGSRKKLNTCLILPVQHVTFLGLEIKNNNFKQQDILITDALCSVFL